MGFKIIKMFSKTFVEIKDHLTRVNAMQRSRNTGPHGGASMSGKKITKKDVTGFQTIDLRYTMYAQVNRVNKARVGLCV